MQNEHTQIAAAYATGNRTKQHPESGAFRMLLHFLHRKVKLSGDKFAVLDGADGDEAMVGAGGQRIDVDLAHQLLFAVRDKLAHIESIAASADWVANGGLHHLTGGVRDDDPGHIHGMAAANDAGEQIVFRGLHGQRIRDIGIANGRRIHQFLAGDGQIALIEQLVESVFRV